MQGRYTLRSFACPPDSGIELSDSRTANTAAMDRAPAVAVSRTLSHLAGQFVGQALEIIAFLPLGLGLVLAVQGALLGDFAAPILLGAPAAGGFVTGLLLIVFRPIGPGMLSNEPLRSRPGGFGAVATAAALAAWLSTLAGPEATLGLAVLAATIGCLLVNMARRVTLRKT